jgi:hypothetical protein
MEQTAVEWFAKRISHGGLVSKKQFNELLQQAKQIEEQQALKLADHDLDELAEECADELADGFDYNDGNGNREHYNNSDIIKEVYIKGFFKAIDLLIINNQTKNICLSDPSNEYVQKLSELHNISKSDVVNSILLGHGFNPLSNSEKTS